MSRFAPYGWNDDAADPARIVPNEIEQAAVARILALKAEGKGPNAVARVMNEEMPKAARGGKWRPKTVLMIMRRSQ